MNGRLPEAPLALPSTATIIQLDLLGKLVRVINLLVTKM